MALPFRETVLTCLSAMEALMNWSMGHQRLKLLETQIESLREQSRRGLPPLEFPSAVVKQASERPRVVEGQVGKKCDPCALTKALIEAHGYAIGVAEDEKCKNDDAPPPPILAGTYRQMNEALDIAIRVAQDMAQEGGMEGTLAGQLGQQLGSLRAQTEHVGDCGQAKQVAKALDEARKAGKGIARLHFSQQKEGAERRAG